MNAPVTTPMQWLLEHFYAPFALAERANAVRQEHFEDRIALRSWPESSPAPHKLLWDGDAPCSPQESAELVAFRVQCDTPGARESFLRWFQERLIEQPGWTELCAWSVSDSSTQRAWLTAALRILAPGTCRVQLRVDELSLRTTQLCLNFGADTLAAPVEAARKLPIAGVASPHESSQVGLATLIEQAGLRPDFSALPPRSS